MRDDRDSSGELARVRVFIDHWEFCTSWQFAYSSFTGVQLTKDDIENAQNRAQAIKWELLPEAVLEHLDELDYIGHLEKEIRNVDIYASVRNSRDQKADNEFRDWLDNTLDPLPGFEVYKFTRKESPTQIHCRKCNAPIEKPELEKGLKTKVACDLLSYAVKDLYDIAVLFADDAELAPSVMCVQEVFDKKVIHVGPSDRGQVLRSAAWGHVMLDDIMRELIAPEDFVRRKRR